MIAARAEALTLLIKENAALDQKIAQSDAYRDTTAALADLNAQIQEFLPRYWRVSDRLDGRIRSDVVRTLEDVKSTLTGIEKELRKEPRQGTAIKQLTNRVTGLSNRVNEAWRTRADEHLRPYQNVLDLVGSLPEIAVKRDSIDQTIERVRTLSGAVPQDDAALDRFDRYMAELEQVLGNIEGLSTTVRDFLQKVVSGRATFVDLDPEIMAWIADRDRARAFQIRFGTGPGPGRGNL